MNGAPDTPHAMTAYAQRFTGSGVAACAGDGVATRFDPVAIRGWGCTDPAGGMGVPARLSVRGEALLAVAALATGLGMARDAQPRFDPRLASMSASKSCAVKSRELRLIETEPLGKRRYIRPVAAGALLFGMARIAYRPTGGGVLGVSANVVLFMNEVGARPHVFDFEIVVAVAAVGELECVAMGVARQARWHAWKQRRI